MPQLSELRTPDDDWTGKTKAEDRRRRQNRLNQRTYRKRKMLQNSHLPLASAMSVLRSGDFASPLSVYGEGILTLRDAEQHVKLYEFTERVYLDYTLYAMWPTYLPALIRLNVLNALAHNATMLGIEAKSLCRDETSSPFNSHGPQAPNGLIPALPYPESLRPTAKQRAVQHHPWLDLFPFPRMRDNMIEGAANGIFDDDMLCYDLVHTGAGSEVEQPALIVWGESWDAQAWEVSIAFLKKWGWLVRGCSEIIDSTNYWREKRGEKKLINVKL
ncbi:hypothetical protein B0T10DRAFT_530957 [Thelonectria olida]|uniref:BZIP domain-containing protein n=1 Tax=Thelonectria olida TaxID=1576542 RepID=A0A9P9AQ06_9HYPO|nr:hypothetical protein B0T10DRAFT_530957 [Thelonectria olida]